MTSRILLVLLLAGATGCASRTEPAALSELEQALNITLDADAELIAGERRDGTAFWLIRTTAPLDMAPHTDLENKQSIPAHVLPGLLAPFHASTTSERSSGPGELIEFRQGTCRVRVRSFQTAEGWYVFIDHFEKALSSG